jgi:hypothetical protein
MNEQGLSGNLPETPFAEIAGALYREERSGSLTLASGERARTIVFYEGSPVAVVSPDPRDHVASLLAAKGKISPEDAAKLQDRPMTKSGLQSADFIDGDTLTWGLKFRFVNLCYDVFRWTEGTYSFEEGPPPRDIFLMKVPTPVLLSKGLKYMPPSALMERIPSELEVESTGGEDGNAGSLGEEGKALHALCREGMSVGEILDASGLKPPRAREILYILKILGDLVLRPPAPSGAGDIGTAGAVPQVPEEKDEEPVFEIERHSYEAESAGGQGALSDEEAPEPLPEQAFKEALTANGPGEELAPIGGLGEESAGETSSPPGLSPIGFDEPLPGPPPELKPAGEKEPSLSPDLPPPPWQGDGADEGLDRSFSEGEPEGSSPFAPPEAAAAAPPGPGPVQKARGLKSPPGSGRKLSSPLSLLILLVLLGAAVVVGAGLWMGSSSMRSPSAPIPPIPPAEKPEALEMAEGLPVPALPLRAAPPMEEPKPRTPGDQQPETEVLKTAPGETPPRTGSAYDAGLAAYEGGSLEEAALLWKSMLQEEEGAYTIQVEVACQPETVRGDFLRFGRGSGLFAVPLQLKGRSCFRVLLGSFPSQEQARAALNDLPVALRSGLTVRAAKNFF